MAHRKLGCESKVYHKYNIWIQYLSDLKRNKIDNEDSNKTAVFNVQRLFVIRKSDEWKYTCVPNSNLVLFVENRYPH